MNMDKYNVKSSNQQMPSFLQAIGAVAPRQNNGSSQRLGANQSSTTSVYHIQSSSRPITSNSLGHQLLADSTFQGGKTVHHMGQPNIIKTKIKEPAVVKIEVGLNPTNLKKQRRSSSGGDGSTRFGSELTSHESTFPPVKKIKLEIGDAGIWETKRESEEASVSVTFGTDGNEDGINSEEEDDDDDDDICPVDYKSRCVILLEEQMQNIVKNFKACAMELHYLENDGDILDYSSWIKNPNLHLDDYLEKMATKYEMSIRGIENEEAKIFVSGSGTLPTITPVAISKKLPPAIAALQQKQMELSEGHVKRFVGGFHSVVYGRVRPQPKNTTSAPLAPGGIPLSTTAATTTIGSPTPINSSCNENVSSSSKSTTLIASAIGLGSNHGTLVRPIPIVAVPSSAAGLLADPIPSSRSSVRPDATAVVTVASIMTASVVGLTRPTGPFHGTNKFQSAQEATVELAKQEAKVLSRVAELRKQGTWSPNRLPKILEPERSRSHWDMLLKEMEWMAVDFAQERRWKIACSSMIACSVIESEAITKRNLRRRREEKRKIDMASYMARIVEEFWMASREEYLFKNYREMEKDCKEVLQNVIATTTKVYLESERNLVSDMDPNLFRAASESSDDREQEIEDLLSSAEWPIENVFERFYSDVSAERDEVRFGGAGRQRKSDDGNDADALDEGAGGDFEPSRYSPDFSDIELDLFKGELKELQSGGTGKALIESARRMKKYENIDDFLSDIPITNTNEDLDLIHNGLFSEVTTLRPYQVSSAARLSKFWLRGTPFLEARDPGLGTKLSVVYHFSTLAFNYQEWGCHLIVIKEKRDLFSWRSSFAKFAPSLKVKVAVDWKEGSDDFFIHNSIEDAAKNFNVLVACQEHIKHHITTYEKFMWKTLVLDKVSDLDSRNTIPDTIFSTFSKLNHNHLIMYFDANAIPSEVFRLLHQDQSDYDDDRRMDCLTNLSETFLELMNFILEGKICDLAKSISNWPKELTSQDASNKTSVFNFCITMDEAAKVFRLLCSSVTKKNVLDQLKTLNILTLASTLPDKQASTYNDGFGALLEESPEVTSPEFLGRVNELYNTCAHLDGFDEVTDHLAILSPCLVDSMNSYLFSSLLDIGNGKLEDYGSQSSLKHLLTLYSWGTGLLEGMTEYRSNARDVATNRENTFECQSTCPYNSNLLRTLAKLVPGRRGDSHCERFDSLKKLMDEIDKDKLLDKFPREIARSLENIVFMMQPPKINFASKGFEGQSFDSVGSEGTIEEEAMDYEDGNRGSEGVDACGLVGGESFDALGSDCLKELTSVGKKCFEEELHKFLVSCKRVICQMLDPSSKKSLCSDAKKLIVPLIKTIDGSPDEMSGKNIDYVDRNIVGSNKGKLSGLSVLLEKRTSEGRFVILSCHSQTLCNIQWFLSRRGFTYLSIDSKANAGKVRKVISTFNFNKKYDCLLIQHPDSSAWDFLMYVLGEDAIPSARNLIVLDEELADVKVPGGRSLWQLLAKKMSASEDLNVIRLYHKNTIEGYQVHRRWSKEILDDLFWDLFGCRRGTFRRTELESSDGGSELFFKDVEEDDNARGRTEEEEVDDLNFIYSSHQDGIGRPHDRISPRTCSCSDESLFVDDETSEEDEGETSKSKQNEIRCYAMTVVDRQLKSSETFSASARPSRFVTDKLFGTGRDDVRRDVPSSGVRTDDDLLTYEVDYLEPECFISDLTGEKMPVWTPPNPPQDDDVFVDGNALLLYELIPMSETQLPSLYIRKGNKRSKMDDSVRSTKTLGRDAKHDSSSLASQRPRSLFERPIAVSQQITIPLSTANSFAYGFQIDRDGRLINKAGVPVGQPYARSPTVPVSVPRPNPETQGDQVDWLVHEEWALLQAYQMTCQDGSPFHEPLNQPPLQSRLPNWELIACIVNGFSRVFRSARQCRLRYENVILPREEGRSHLDNGQRKFKKTSKGLYKTKSGRQQKTIQMYGQDNNRSLITHLSLRFDLLKNFLGKKHLRKIAGTATQVGKTNHVAFMLEHNVAYDRPLSPVAIAEMKLERTNKEKEKRAVAAPERVQQTPPAAAPSSNSVNSVLNAQQQQTQQPAADSAPASVAPVSTSLTLPLGHVSFVLPNSQLRMAVPGVASNQQQQQVILQAQQQMAIVASAASNSMLGKVPLVGGVSNSVTAVRNLTNLSFVVNQSAAANQQSATFVTVSKAQGTVASTVGLVTSLSPATIKAIRNINPAAVGQLANGINVGQSKAVPSAAAVAFPSGIIQNNRFSIRGHGTIQLNQRLTQKPVTSQQQVTLTAGANLSGIQKLGSVGVVPTTQTFHVKNPQVLLKSKQPTGTPQQQLSGATVVSRLAAVTSNQGPSLQFQHLHIQSKTPLLEVMQQQQLQSSSAQQNLPINFTSAAASGMNVTTLIKSVSANSNLGKVLTPTQTAIRQSQVAKRPTVTAINIPGQGNRTALLGIQQVTKGTGSSQVIYQQPKLVLQPQVKQQAGVQFPQGAAILAMTPRVSINAVGLGSNVVAGNGVAIPINQTVQSVVGSGQPVRVAKQMINVPKVAPSVQHVTVRPSVQQQQPSPSTTVSSATPCVSNVRPQNPTSSS